MRSLFVLLIFFSLQTWATEVDNFTASYTKIKDSTSTYNNLINAEISKTINEVNTDDGPDSCDKTMFYHRLMDKVGGWVKSNIEKWPATKDGIDSTSTGYFSSVYSGSRVAGGLASPMAFLLAQSSFAEYVVNVNGVQIGSDKIGHFFHTGFEAFEAVELSKDKDYPSLTTDEMRVAFGTEKINSLTGDAGVHEFSDIQEKSLWGLTGTGVYSNADKAANYDGYTFWKNLFAGQDPMLTCKNGKIEQRKKFDFANYVNPAWNESINCSTYTSNDVENVVTENVKALQASHKEKPTGCPVKPEECPPLVQRYGAQAKSVLHPKCYGMKAGTSRSGTDNIK